MVSDERNDSMNQIVTINKDWRIDRMDVRNWEIQHLVRIKEGKNAGNAEWQGLGYYSTLRQALLALPDKMLDEVASGNLTDVKNALAGIREAIKGL